MARPLDEETLYLLLFGNLSAPPEQVSWTASADQARPIRDSFALSEGVPMRLMSGDEVSLTESALRVARRARGELRNSASTARPVRVTPAEPRMT